VKSHLEPLALGIIAFFDDVTEPFFKFIERAAVVAALWWAGNRTSSQTLRGLAFLAAFLLSVWAARQIATRLPARWTDPDADHGSPWRARIANAALILASLGFIVSMALLLGDIIDKLAPPEANPPTEPPAAKAGS